MKSILDLSFDRVAPAARRLAVVVVYSLAATLSASMLLSPVIAQQCAGSCFNPGCLDSSFGNCGLVLTDVSHASLTSDHDGAHGLVMQSDSKLITTGTTNYNGSGVQFAAVRYNPDGTLDNTFGNIDPNTNQHTGFVITPFNYQGVSYNLISAEPATLQKVPTATGMEERLIQAGVLQSNSAGYDFAVVRYTPAGDLDSSFNGSGKQIISVGSTSAGVYACAIQGDGTEQSKIILAGYSGLGWVFVRLNSNGTLDTTFGSLGKTVVPFGNIGNSLAWAVTIQQTLTGERILGVGRAYSSNKTGYDFALVRLTLSGALDNTFGTNGKVVTDFYRNPDQAFQVAIDPSTGDILAAGSALQSSKSSSEDFALARYDQNGRLLTSFGISGRVTTDLLGNVDRGMGIAIQWDGKIVVGGEVRNGAGTYDLAVARYNSSGSLDATFGAGGKVITDFAGYQDFGGDLVLQPLNGFQRIVIAGATGVTDPTNPNYGYNYALARYFE
jgi:uncharacterized delta-60 repeat protein